MTGCRKSDIKMQLNKTDWIDFSTIKRDIKITRLYAKLNNTCYIGTCFNILCAATVKENIVRAAIGFPDV